MTQQKQKKGDGQPSRRRRRKKKSNRRRIDTFRAVLFSVSCSESVPFSSPLWDEKETLVLLRTWRTLNRPREEEKTGKRFSSSQVEMKCFVVIWKTKKQREREKKKKTQQQQERRRRRRRGKFFLFFFFFSFARLSSSSHLLSQHQASSFFFPSLSKTPPPQQWPLLCPPPWPRGTSRVLLALAVGCLARHPRRRYAPEKRRVESGEILPLSCLLFACALACKQQKTASLF